MGSALAFGFARGLPETISPSITVVEPNDVARNALAQNTALGITCVSSLSALTISSPPDIVLLAVKPQALAALSSELTLFCALHSPKLILSILAGITIERLTAIVGGVPILRAMPNTPALIGEGITACVASTGISAAQKAQATELLSSVGDVVWLEKESLLDVATALSGSGPAYMFHLLECLVNASVARGLNAESARRLAIHTMRGSASLALASHETLEQLRENVTSPAGTTEAALKRLIPALSPLIDTVLDAAIARAQELSQAD
jgi:pyrroline-5-carboxylate reductase